MSKEAATEPKQVVIHCQKCDKRMDVTEMDFGDEVECPHCSAHFIYSTTFGHYEIVKKVGQGGMGGVYRACDLKLQRDVAIKLLKPELMADKEFSQNFLQEAEVTASLNHPNIVQVYAFGEQNGTYFLVMEMIEGGSLDDKIMDSPRLDELAVLNTAIGVANGLQAAQERNLIHRDIKPGNILYGSSGEGKLVDFGLARLPGQEDRFATQIWGTPYYVAPEKLEQKPETFKADMYSLGTTLFHALTGRPPYEADDPNEVARKHLVSRMLSVKSLAPHVTTKTAQVIRQMTERDPDDRYESYAELIADLDDARRRLIARRKTPRSVAGETSGIWIGDDSEMPATAARKRRMAAPASEDDPDSQIVILEDEKSAATRNILIGVAILIFTGLMLAIYVWLAASSKSRLRSTLDETVEATRPDNVQTNPAGERILYSRNFQSKPNKGFHRLNWDEKKEGNRKIGYLKPQGRQARVRVDLTSPKPLISFPVTGLNVKATFLETEAVRVSIESEYFSKEDGARRVSKVVGERVAGSSSPEVEFVGLLPSAGGLPGELRQIHFRLHNDDAPKLLSLELTSR